MPSTCPSCRQKTLAPAEIEPLLRSHRCGQCGGQWLGGEHYHQWLKHPDRKPSDANAQASGGEESRDSARAMLCPECGRILGRYRVGHGVNFYIDHCGGCGGVWLDAKEWEALRDRQLADRIHLVFSTAWQAQILRDRQRRAAEQRLTDRIGAADFQRLREVTAWIESHPHSSEIAAHLLHHLRTLAPPTREQQRA